MAASTIAASGSTPFIKKNGLNTKVEKSRTQLKERKNRAKKIRGVTVISNTLLYKTPCFTFDIILMSFPVWLTKTRDAAKK
ncbi:hypothetical protein IFM89_039995 [Coptis chinensis]|uniref:Uncharacterized protein n=1 Tax=Coptis chinensis TaxID=261450 RepID=A0A835GSE4_9MAGN|nr:hypothetical protein IFM89_039995 [Coptis chinensis]